VVGSRALVVGAREMRRRRGMRPRRRADALGTGVGWARVDEGVGFESARGKVARSKGDGTLRSIMRL